MIKKLTDIIKDLTIRKFWLLKLARNYKGSYFTETGWIKTFKQRKIIDKSENEIPWITYSAYKILDDKLNKGTRLYEYGCGASTAYFSAKGCIVRSVEHDEEWYRNLLDRKLPNTKLIHKELGKPYIESIKSSDTKYDIVVVDGRHRVACFDETIKHLNGEQIIILDDSHREQYSPAFKLATDSGYKVLNCWGMANGSIGLKCTSIFYKENNCLSI